MGTLVYASTTRAEIDDRALAHLRVVIGIKLRRNESFYFTWRQTDGAHAGVTTIWLHPSIPLSFELLGSRDVSINPRWVEELMLTANTPSGLQLVPEPDGRDAQS